MLKVIKKAAAKVEDAIKMLEEYMKYQFKRKPRSYQLGALKKALELRV